MDSCGLNPSYQIRNNCSLSRQHTFEILYNCLPSDWNLDGHTTFAAGKNTNDHGFLVFSYFITTPITVFPSLLLNHMKICEIMSLQKKSSTPACGDPEYRADHCVLSFLFFLFSGYKTHTLWESGKEPNTSGGSVTAYIQTMQNRIQTMQKKPLLILFTKLKQPRAYGLNGCGGLRPPQRSLFPNKINWREWWLQIVDHYIKLKNNI